MSNRVYFPADLGDLPSKRGQDGSPVYPVILTDDISGKLPVRFDIEPLVDLLFDQFGNNNTKNRKGLYSDVNRYGLDRQEWDVESSLTGDITEPIEAIHPVTVTSIRNLIPTYNADESIANINYDGAGIALKLPKGSVNTIGIRQALLSSKRRFRVNAGTSLFFTMGVKAQGQGGESSIKRWGAFSNNTGVYMELIGNGIGDNFRIVRQCVESNTVKFQVIPRSQWADPLDGSGASESFVSLSNVSMWGFEISSSDGGVITLYVYCRDVKNNIFRWVKFASIGVADSDTLRLLQEEGLPITFTNTSLVPPQDDQLLIKYGVSVSSSQGKEGDVPSNFGHLSVSGSVERSLSRTAIAMVEAKNLISDRPMSSLILPTQLRVRTNNLINLSLILNPDFFQGAFYPVNYAYYENNLVNLYSILNPSEIIGGLEIGNFIVKDSDVIDLRMIASRVRSFLSCQFNNPFVRESSSSFLAVIGQSRLYFAAKAASPGYSSEALTSVLAGDTRFVDVSYSDGAPTIIDDIFVDISLSFEAI